MIGLLWFGLGGVVGGYMTSKAYKNVVGGVARAGMKKLDELPEPCRTQVKDAVLSMTTDDLSRGIFRQFGVKQDLIDDTERTVTQLRAEGKMLPAMPIFAQLPAAAAGQLYDPNTYGYGEYAPHTEYGAHQYFDRNATWNTYTAGSPPMHATGQFYDPSVYGYGEYPPHTDYGAHNYLDPNATWNFYAGQAYDPTTYGYGEYPPHTDYGPHGYMSHGGQAQWYDYAGQDPQTHAAGALPPWFWPGAIGFALGNITRGWWQHSPHLLDISVMGQPGATTGQMYDPGTFGYGEYPPHMDYGPHGYMSHGGQAQWNDFTGQAPPPPPPPGGRPAPPAIPSLPNSHPYNRYWNHMASRDQHWRGREQGWRQNRQWHPSWGAQPPAPPRI